MVLVDSHGDAHAMMAFVLLSERSVIGEIKTIDFWFHNQTPEEKKIAKLVSLIIQNSTKHIAHTQRKADV
jgi:hypothetical protein